MASPAARMRTPTSGTRADVVDRYRRMRKKRIDSISTTPKAAQSSSNASVSDENYQPTTPAAALKLTTTTPRSTATNPLSPKNNGMTSGSSFMKKKSSLAVKPTPPLRILTSTVATTATPPFTSRNPLSPKNNGMTSGSSYMKKKSSTLAVKPTPPPRILTSTVRHEPSPLAASSPSVAGSARRERVARHSKLLGNRGGRTTPRNSSSSSVSVTNTPATITTKTPASSSRPSLSRAQSASSVLPSYYSYEPPPLPSSGKKKEKGTPTKPPTTPSTTLKHFSSNGSVCSMDAKDISKRVRERRARGAKKLFIMATSDDSDEHHHHGNLTPLERHLSSHDKDAAVAVDDEDCPSVASDISTITMSTLLSLARDRRNFSRDPKYRASKLYARATTTSITSSSTEEKTETTRSSASPVGRRRHRGRSPARGRSPIRNRSSNTPSRASSPPPRGTPVRSNTVSRSKGQEVQPAGSRSTASDSPSAATSLSKRANTMQKAKRLARARSRSCTRTTNQAQSSPVERRRYESPARRHPSPVRCESPARTVSSSRTPRSAGSSGSAGSTRLSRAGSRAASVQRARHTLARTKSQQKMKVESTAAPTTMTSQKTPPPPPPPVFAAREKVESRARSLSLAPQTRRNLDKRTARLKYHNEFALEVIKCQEESGHFPPAHFEGENMHKRGENGLSIFIRKRPIFDYEIQAGDFDVVFTEGRDGHDAVVLHSCNMHADMRKMLIKPIAFPCSAAFDETCTNDQLYTHVGKPLVRLAANGSLATLITYGQTGSGKTHTITGMEERVCQDLFRMATKFVQVKVQFVELAGKQCKDLLGDGDVKLVDQEDGSVLLLDAVSESAHSPGELYNSILRAKQKRATESTDKNDMSSRSHAVCRIVITNTKNEEFRGVLTLIDCAGSERRNDSLYHNKDRQQESTAINESLFYLKECIRARASGGKKNGPIPYRSSNLTRILRESLERDDAQLCVVATVAANATDTEHSIETLKTVTQLAAMESTVEEMNTHEFTPIEKNQLPLTPNKWDRTQLVEWLRNKRFDVTVPENVDGKRVMRMNRLQLNNAFYGGSNAQKADRLYTSLRTESERVSRAQRQERVAISREKYEL